MGKYTFIILSSLLCFLDHSIFAFDLVRTDAQEFRPLTGRAFLQISGAPLVNFGTKPVGSTTDFTLKVTNTGNKDAYGIRAHDLGPAFQFKDGKYPGLGGTCSISLVPMESCTLQITFTPPAQGTFKSELEIRYNYLRSSQERSNTTFRTLLGVGQ